MTSKAERKIRLAQDEAEDEMEELFNLIQEAGVDPITDEFAHIQETIRRYGFACEEKGRCQAIVINDLSP